MNWFFIINPKASGGRVMKRWQQLEGVLQSSGLAYRAVFTEYKNHCATVVEQAYLAGERQFVVVGGDGSIQELVNGMMHSDAIDVSACVVAVYPCGTGNDWAAYYGLPRRANAFVAILKNPRYKFHDIGEARYRGESDGAEVPKTHYFINFLGAGYDSYTLEKMGSAAGSQLSYIKNGIKFLAQYRSPEFCIRYQGTPEPLKERSGEQPAVEKVITQRSLMLMACIGKYGGAGMRFAPDAKADDGIFDLLVVKDMPFIKRLYSMIKLYDGKINQYAQAITDKSPVFVIDVNRKPGVNNAEQLATKFQCDGEVIAPLPVEVRCLQKVLKICVP